MVGQIGAVWRNKIDLGVQLPSYTTDSQKPGAACHIDQDTVVCPCGRAPPLGVVACGPGLVVVRVRCPDTNIGTGPGQSVSG